MKKINKLVFILFSILLSSCSSTTHTHDWSKFVYYDENYHYKVCTDESHIEKENHNYELVKSYITNGHKYNDYKCNKCNRKKTEEQNEFIEGCNNEVVDEKFLKEKVSEATSIYYKSNNDNQYSNECFLYTTLPSNYIELEYIELQNLQYLDTGVYFNSDDYEIEVIYSTFKNYTNKNQVICGCGDINWYGPAFINIYKGQYEYGVNGFTSYIGNIECNVKNKVKLIEKNNTHKLYVDDQLLHSLNKEFVTSSYSLTIGKFNGPNIPLNSYFNGLIYSFKITQDGQITRNYVPVLNKETNQAGLYDLVNDDFITNSMIIENDYDCFSYGSKVDNDDRLPNSYQQVDYLITDGNGFIETNFRDTNGVLIKTELYSSSSDELYIGSHDVEEPYCRNGSYIRKDGSFEFGYGSNCNWYGQAKLNTWYKLEWSTLYNNGYLNVDGVNLAKEQYQSISRDYITLFNNSYGKANGITGSSGKVKYIKIYDHLYNLKRDFIPCYRKDDNIVGLYDFIENKFYTNSNTPTLIIPGNILLPDENKEIIVSSSDGQIGIVKHSSAYFESSYEEIIDPLSYKIDFVYNKNLASINIYKNTSLTSYDVSDLGYSISKTTYNKSTTNNILIFKVNLKDNLKIKSIDAEGICILTKDKDFYYLENISSNTKISITFEDII